MLHYTQLEQLRRQRPLIHCVSNIVSANDCANLALAVGASPIMAQALQEMESITAASQATVLNLGTPSEEKFSVARLCLQEAHRLGHPVVLDPVGVGASPWRLDRTLALLEHASPTILRANLGEAQALLRQNSMEQGVDSPGPATWEERRETATALARQYGTTVLLSGTEDVVTDGTAIWRVTGGSDWMSKITGTGCMLSVLCGAFAAVEPEPLQAAALACAFWKVCAQTSEKLAQGHGPATFRTALLDTAGTLTAAEFAAQAAVIAE